VLITGASREIGSLVQPAYPAVNWGHPLADKLFFAYVATAGRRGYDLVNAELASRDQSTIPSTIVHGPKGTAPYFDRTFNERLRWNKESAGDTKYAIATNGQFSLFHSAWTSHSAANDGPFAVCGTTTGLKLHQSSGGADTIYYRRTNGTVLYGYNVPTDWNNYVVRDDGLGDQEIWLNGKFWSGITNGGTGGTGGAASSGIGISGHGMGSDTDWTEQAVVATYMWRRRITDAEILALEDDPYQMFIEPGKRSSIVFFAGLGETTFDATDYLEDAVLDHTIAGTSMAQPSAVYVSLHSADPTDTGGVGEIAGGSYSRQVASSWAAASAGSKSTTGAIVFTGLPAATINGYAIWDASSGGNCLYTSHGLAVPVTVGAGDELEFGSGDITVTLD
jgi:hypothetical protein